MKKFILILTIGFAIMGCDKATEACMEVSETSVSAGTPVNFKSCSENALSIEWFMSGPESAPENEMGWSDPEFTHTFSVPGTYTVTLNAYQDFSFKGDLSSVQETIIVN